MSTPSQSKPGAEQVTRSRPTPHNAPQHDSRALLGQAGRATIMHEGIPYTLRVTRNGKLILTK